MVDQLEYFDELTKLVKDYKPPKESLNLFGKLRLVLLVAATSSGRNTLINRLVKQGNYHFLVSDTTRPPRSNDGVLEQNGVNYWFKNEAQVLDRIKRRDYVEVSIIHNQQVSGISTEEVIRANNSHKIALKDIDYQGSEKLFKLKPDATFFFILPPSMPEWMSRIRGRGYMDETEVKRRLSSAATELDHAIKAKHYSFIINQDLNKTAEKIDGILNGSKVGNGEQQAGLVLAQQLYDELRLSV